MNIEIIGWVVGIAFVAWLIYRITMKRSGGSGSGSGGGSGKGSKYPTDLK